MRGDDIGLPRGQSATPVAGLAHVSDAHRCREITSPNAGRPVGGACSASARPVGVSGASWDVL